MASSVGDLLTAASLLLAAVGVVYESWYGDLKAAIEEPIPIHTADRGQVRDALRVALWRRAAPLALFSLCTGLVLLPDAIASVINSIRIYCNVKPALRSYDGLTTLFFTVEVFTLAFTLHLLGMTLGLKRRLNKVNEVK